MASITVRISFAFIIITAVAIGIVAFMANQTTANEFGYYLERGGMVGAERARFTLSAYFEKRGDWEGVQNLIENLGRPTGEWMVLTDGRGRVLADSNGNLIGRTVSESMGSSLPVMAGNRQVGVLHVVGGEESGLGRRRNMAPMMGGMMDNYILTLLQHMGAAEQEYLNSVNRAIWIGGAAAGGTAVLLSLFLAFQITRPLRRLTFAARQIAAGDLTHRVPVNTKDEIGALADSFNAMADTLAKNEQQRRNMVADIAHELRTPLTIIQGNLEAMLDGVVEPTPEQIASVHAESVLLGRLVSDLRDLSLAEAGQLRLDRSPVHIEDLIDKAVNKVQIHAQERGVKMLLSVPDDLPEVNVDEHRLLQVLGNLLDNALRYTPEGGNIHIEVIPAEEESFTSPGFITVYVSDTGPGIALEDLPRVFDRFYRADPSRTRSSGGSGIGLAIVKQLVEMHGGLVWVTSEVGNGATFAFTIPYSLTTEPR